MLPPSSSQRPSLALYSRISSRVSGCAPGWCRPVGARPPRLTLVLAAPTVRLCVRSVADLEPAPHPASAALAASALNGRLSDSPRATANPSTSASEALPKPFAANFRSWSDVESTAGAPSNVAGERRDSGKGAWRPASPHTGAPRSISRETAAAAARSGRQADEALGRADGAQALGLGGFSRFAGLKRARTGVVLARSCGASRRHCSKEIFCVFLMVLGAESLAGDLVVARRWLWHHVASKRSVGRRAPTLQRLPDGDHRLWAVWSRVVPSELGPRPPSRVGAALSALSSPQLRALWRAGMPNAP